MIRVHWQRFALAMAGFLGGSSLLLGTARPASAQSTYVRYDEKCCTGSTCSETRCDPNGVEQCVPTFTCFPMPTDCNCKPPL